MATNGEVQKGWEYLDAIPRYRRVDANVNLMSHAIHSEDKTITTEILHKIFNRIKPKLAINGDYAEAYRVFFEKHPEYALECNMAILDAALIKRSDAVTAENLEELLLPGNPHNVISQLAITAEARQAQVEARETERMISEITGYMLDAKGKVKQEYTERQYRDKIAGLRSMPFSQLSARYDEVIRVRGLRKTPVEAIRAVVKTDAKAQRKEIFSTEPPDVELLNPNTNQPFTGRKELVNFLNSLSREETRAYFSFPEGRPKPGVAEAVTRILKGAVQ
jgi:hypothetical protein